VCPHTYVGVDVGTKVAYRRHQVDHKAVDPTDNADAGSIGVGAGLLHTTGLQNIILTTKNFQDV